MSNCGKHFKSTNLACPQDIVKVLSQDILFTPLDNTEVVIESDLSAGCQNHITSFKLKDDSKVSRLTLPQRSTAIDMYFSWVFDEVTGTQLFKHSAKSMIAGATSQDMCNLRSMGAGRMVAVIKLEGADTDSVWVLGAKNGMILEDGEFKLAENSGYNELPFSSKEGQFELTPPLALKAGVDFADTPAIEAAFEAGFPNA